MSKSNNPTPPPKEKKYEPQFKETQTKEDEDDHFRLSGRSSSTYYL